MAVFNLDELNDGAWFDFDDAEIKLRAPNNDFLSSVSKECVREKKLYKKKNRVGDLQLMKETETDDDKLKAMIWDYTIMEWKNIKTQNGEDIPCTKENKVKLMGGSPKFYHFVDSAVDQLSSDQSKEAEDLEKN